MRKIHTLVVTSHCHDCQVEQDAFADCGTSLQNTGRSTEMQSRIQVRRLTEKQDVKGLAEFE